jgi:hypothetical protein
VNDVVIEEAKDRQPPYDGCIIPPPVLLELPGFEVEGYTVEFHNEEALEQEVHRPDPV